MKSSLSQELKDVVALFDQTKQHKFDEYGWIFLSIIVISYSNKKSSDNIG